MPSDPFDWNWRRRPLFWAAAAVACVLAVWRPDFCASDDLSRRIGGADPVYVAGRVDSEVEPRLDAFGEETVSFTLAAGRFWARPSDAPAGVSGRARVTLRGTRDVRYGDLIAVSGRLEAPRGLRNPGGFDQRRWLARQGIRSVFYGSRDDRLKVLARGRGQPMMAAILRFKAACLERLQRDFSERDAPILAALFFGVRSDIDDAVRDSFLKTGTLHLLAVSGFNVGFVIAAVLFALGRLHVRRALNLAAALAAAWLYVALVGFQAPVFRAGVMASVWLAGEMAGRRSDALNSLGLSALILWALRPLELFDPGFQLSYAAVIGIVAAVPRLLPADDPFPEEAPSFARRAARESRLLFWTSFAAQTATTPVSAAHFYAITPWAVFANVPAAFLVFVIFMAGAFQLAVSLVFPPLGGFLAGFVRLPLELLVQILAGFERIPPGLWTTGRLSAPVWLALTAATGVFLFSSRGRPLVRAAAWIAAAAVCFTVQDAWRQTDRSMRVTFLDVGQGDAIHLRFPDGSNWLVDAGQGRSPDAGRAVLVPYLRHEGVRRLDSVVVTHPQEDHLGGLASLLENVEVSEYLDPGVPHASVRYQRLLADLRRRHIPIVTVRAGDRSDFEGDVRVRVLSAGLPPGSRDVNDASVVLRVDHPSGSVLLTGDAGEGTFARLNAGRVERADVLKVPHHGARPGPEERAFLAAAAAPDSVISVSAHNPFGHPSPELLAALEAVPGSTIHRTDRSGAVRVVLGPSGRRVLDGPQAFA